MSHGETTDFGKEKKDSPDASNLRRTFFWREPAWREGLTISTRAPPKLGAAVNDDEALAKGMKTMVHCRIGRFDCKGTGIHDESGQRLSFARQLVKALVRNQHERPERLAATFAGH